MAKIVLSGVLVLAVIAAGWALLGDDGLKSRGSKKFSYALIEVNKSGEERYLSELQDVPSGWDQVVLFSEGANAENIEKIVGANVITGEYMYSANLFVFLKDGEVVDAIESFPDTFLGPYGVPLGPNTKVVPAEGREGFLKLAE